VLRTREDYPVNLTRYVQLVLVLVELVRSTSFDQFQYSLYVQLVLVLVELVRSTSFDQFQYSLYV
jgi:hypothetical protein